VAQRYNAKSVLVLDGHSRAAVEVVQSLGAKGVKVDIAAEQPDAVGFLSKYARRHIRQPASASELVTWLDELQRRIHYSLIVPTTEGSLQAFRLIGEANPLWRIALLPPQKSLEIALNKQSTWMLANSIGVPVPESRLIERGVVPPRGTWFPSVLKPVHSVVTIDERTMRLEPVIVRDEAERARQLARLLPATSVQEQQYIGGRGVGVECLYARGRMVWHFVHERIHELPLTGGGSTYRKSVPPEATIVLAARRLLDALKWHGVAMVEFKRTADGDFHLMEINPRLWGSLALAIDAGVDFPWGMWLIANRHPAGPQPLYRIPYYTRYLPGDVDWMKDNFRADHADRLLMTRPTGEAVLEYLRPLVGRESWDHFRWSDIGICAAQIKQVTMSNLRNAIRLIRRRRLVLRLKRQHTRLKRTLVRAGSMPRNILFICYGNICRSPFAEVYAATKFPDVRVHSAGFHEHDGRSSPAHLVSAAAELGMDLIDHRSQRINASMVEEAGLILVMDLENFEALARAFPAAVAKTACLGSFVEGMPLEIEDPYLLSSERTIEILVQIMAGVDGIFKLMERKSDPPLEG